MNHYVYLEPGEKLWVLYRNEGDPTCFGYTEWAEQIELVPSQEITGSDLKSTETFPLTFTDCGNLCSQNYPKEQFLIEAFEEDMEKSKGYLSELRARFAQTSPAGRQQNEV